MKKYYKIFSSVLKIFSSVLICCIPLSLITYFAVPWKSYPTISSAGSSALQPLVTEFSDKWNSNTDLIVQGGGSGFGMKSIATSTKDIGAASKNTYDSAHKATMAKNGYTIETWEDKAIKTLTIGWDSIAIVYKISDKNAELELRTDNNSLSELYKMFSGIKTVRVKELIPDSESDGVFIPYGRTGGAKASGTATSFMYESTFDWNQDDSELKEAETALKSGSYLNNNVRTTNESNVEAWNKVKYENYDNSIIYLSLAFALQNYDDLQKNGFRIATFEGVDPYEYVQKNSNVDIAFLQEYKWFSPFNLMISLNEANQYTKEFIEWVYLSDEAKKVFNNQKIVPVDKTEYFKAMIAPELKFDDMKTDFQQVFNPINGDVSLEKLNNKPSEDKSDKYFGIAKNVILKQE